MSVNQYEVFQIDVYRDSGWGPRRNTSSEFLFALTHVSYFVCLGALVYKSASHNVIRLVQTSNVLVILTY